MNNESIMQGETLSTIALAKNFSYLVTFITTMEWLGLNPQAVSIFALLMVVDVVTGVARAASVEGGRSIRSAILKRGILAKLLVLTALFSSALAGRGLGFEVSTFAQAAVNVLILGELYSILGNIHSVRTGKQKAEFDAVAFLLARVRELLEKALK